MNLSPFGSHHFPPPIKQQQTQFQKNLPAFEHIFGFIREMGTTLDHLTQIHTLMHI